MAEAEIESLLDKKYAEIENDFAALLGSAILQPQQVEAIKVTFDLTSEKEIARVLEARGGANPDAVAAARKRTNTKLTGFLAMYDQPASATPKQVLSDGQLNDLLKDFENGQLAETRKRADTRSADYKAKRTSVQLSPQKAPVAAAVVSIPANKAAAPGGFTPTALNSSTDGGRDRSTSTLISPRKRMNSDVPDSAKRLSLFEAQLMEETERARAMMAEQQAKERDAKAREAAAAAQAPPRDDPPSPRPGPFVRHDPPRSDSSSRRNYVPAPVATNNRGSIGGYRPPSISGNATAVRSSSPRRNSGNTTLPPMKPAPAPGLVDEPLLIDSYHRLPDDVPKEKDRSCTNCTLV